MQEGARRLEMTFGIHVLCLPVEGCGISRRGHILIHTMYTVYGGLMRPHTYFIRRRLPYISAKLCIALMPELIFQSKNVRMRMMLFVLKRPS